MSIAAIEINDAGLVLADESGVLGEPSPGFAQVESRDIRVGKTAMRAARLKPRRTTSRFWSELSREPLPRPYPRGLSNADLAHAHLADVWRQAQSKGELQGLLVVPGSFSDLDLSLVLGIARACEISVAGMADAALVSVADAPVKGRILHLDLELHRAVWSELELDGALARRRAQIVDGCGLHRLRDSWAKFIAEQFLRQTRFDPFHRGESEQILFDELAAWLSQSARQSTVLLQMKAAGRELEIEVSQEQLVAVGQPAFGPIVETGKALLVAGEPPAVLLSQRVAGLPGLASRLAEGLQVEPLVLPIDAAVSGALGHRDQIVVGGSELSLATSLVVDVSKPTRLVPVERSRTPSAVANAARPPSHLVYEDLAHVIDEVPLWLGISVDGDRRGLELTGETAGISRQHCCILATDEEVVVEDHSTYGTFVNGLRVDGRATLNVGDRLRLGSPGVEIALIGMAEIDG